MGGYVDYIDVILIFLTDNIQFQISKFVVPFWTRKMTMDKVSIVREDLEGFLFGPLCEQFRYARRVSRNVRYAIRHASIIHSLDAFNLPH